MKKFTALTIMVLGLVGMLAAVSQAWNYNSSDLFGANCLQSQVDILKSGTVTNAARKVVVGPDNTTILAVATGSCTNGQAVTFGTAFAEIPMVAIQQVNTNNVCYATSTATNGFTAVVYGSTTQKWFAIGAK